MTTPNPRNLLTGTTPGPWSDQWSQLEPCVVALVGYTKIDGYNHPQERAADIAQKDKDRALAAAAPDLAARVIALEDEIKDLIERTQRWIDMGDRDEGSYVSGLEAAYSQDMRALRAILDGDTIAAFKEGEA